MHMVYNDFLCFLKTKNRSVTNLDLKKEHFAKPVRKIIKKENVHICD